MICWQDEFASARIGELAIIEACVADDKSLLNG